MLMHFQRMDPLLVLASQPPPIVATVPLNNLNFDNLKKIVALKWEIKDPIAEVVKDLSILKEEFVLLNQVLYKIHNRFHNDKGYKDLRMYEKSLNKFLKLNFVVRVEGVISFLPESVYFPTSLPTRSMAQHTALQIYGAVSLLHRLHNIAINCGLLAIQRLNLGHFWGVAAHQIACISRTWLVGRHLLGKLAALYVSLIELLPFLHGDASVPLPNHLNNFVSEDLIEKVKEERLNESVDLNKTLSVECFLDIGVPVKRLKESMPKAQPKHDPNLVTEDVQITKPIIASEDSLSKIHSLEELKHFIETENKTRKISKKTCYTRKLPQTEWKSLKNKLFNSINDKIPNKSLKRCRKLIREAIDNQKV